jgi:hypothetical protein
MKRIGWLVGLVVLVPGCGGGELVSGSTFVDVVPSSVSETTEFHWSPIVCDLRTIIRESLGAAVGSAIGLDGPFFDEAPANTKGFEYWLVTVTVERVAAGTLDRAVWAGNNPLPPITVGEKFVFTVHPDNQATSLDQLKTAVEEGSTIVALLAAGGDPNRSEEMGGWFARRAGVVTDTGVGFSGPCGAEVEGQLNDLAASLGRNADLGFLLEFEEEVLARLDDLENPGPIEQAWNDLNS